MPLLRAIRVGDHVLILPNKPNGEAHPQAGKTGIVTEILGIVTGLFNPRAMVKLDTHCEHGGNITVVSLGSLSQI
jgi:hypothetical protein